MFKMVGIVNNTAKTNCFYLLSHYYSTHINYYSTHLERYHSTKPLNNNFTKNDTTNKYNQHVTKDSFYLRHCVRQNGWNHKQCRKPNYFSLLKSFVFFQLKPCYFTHLKHYYSTKNPSNNFIMDDITKKYKKHVAEDSFHLTDFILHQHKANAVAFHYEGPKITFSTSAESIVSSESKDFIFQQKFTYSDIDKHSR
eukprot:Pgem_evm1s10195